MTYNKDTLIKLINLVKEIAKDPNNSWFRTLLVEEFSQDMTVGEMEPSSTEAFIRLQKKIFRKKAFEYYKNINDSKLKGELVRDHQEMLWHKVLNQVDKQYLFAYYQLENMLNYYVLSNDVYVKIKQSPDKYIMQFNEKFEVVPYNSFFNKESQPVELNKVSSIYAKLAFWAVETGNKSWILDNSRKYHLGNLVQIRNMKSHRNSQIDYSYLNNQIEYYKKGDDINNSYIVSILTRMKTTLFNSEDNSGVN
jgi:hypothetical protein